MINNVLRKYLDIFVVTYFDNILVYFKIFEEHVGYVEKVLDCFKEKQLKLKLEKCKFYRRKKRYVNQSEETINGKKIENTY